LVAVKLDELNARRAQTACTAEYFLSYSPNARIKLYSQTNGGGQRIIRPFRIREYPMGAKKRPVCRDRSSQPINPVKVD
jgi:hypothetical protein